MSIPPFFFLWEREEKLFSLDYYEHPGWKFSALPPTAKKKVFPIFEAGGVLIYITSPSIFKLFLHWHKFTFKGITWEYHSLEFESYLSMATINSEFLLYLLLRRHHNLTTGFLTRLGFLLNKKIFFYIFMWNFRILLKFPLADLPRSVDATEIIIFKSNNYILIRNLFMSYLLTGLRLGMILVSFEQRWAGVRWQVSWGTSWVSCNLKFNVYVIF